MGPRPNHAPTTLIGLFKHGTPITQVLDRCRSLGVPDSALDVLSTIPLSYPHAQQASALPLHRWTLGGGLLGLCLGVALAAGTALLYPLQTGGLSIVARPVVGLIAYEGMMLMAIVMTFLAMMRRVRQTARRPHDARIDEGFIGLSIALDDQAPPIDQLRSVLEEAGAREVVER
jgi:hypothetical protein